MWPRIVGFGVGLQPRAVRIWVAVDRDNKLKLKTNRKASTVLIKHGVGVQRPENLKRRPPRRRRDRHVPPHAATSAEGTAPLARAHAGRRAP